MGQRVGRSLTAKALALELGAQCLGDDAVQITGVASLERATVGDLSFFSDAKHRAAATNTAASVLIVSDADADIASCTRIIHAAPHTAFASALDLLFPAPPHAAEVSPLALVAASARVGGVRVDAFASVGERTVIGTGSVISAHVHIGDDVVIGERCLLHPGVRVLAGVRLGDRCILQSGAVVGSDGFGFQSTREGWRKVDQVGTVIVGNDVTHERVIREQIVLLPGATFNRDLLIRSYQAVSNLNFFEQPMAPPEVNPTENQVDVDLVFRVREKQTLEFRTEAQNVLNHTNFGDPVVNRNNSNFGRILSAGNARIMQFSLKYAF